MYFVFLLCLSPYKKRASKEQRERDSEKSVCENKGKCFGAKMKNKWEEQFIDPFASKVNVWSLALFISH